MQSQCPHCHTIFKLLDSQIEQAEGQVRCGHCLAIFTAEILPEDSHQDQSQAVIIQQDNFTIEDIPTVTTSSEEPVELPDVVPPELRAEISNPTKHYSSVSSIFWTLAIISLVAAGVLQYAFYDRIQLVKHNELRPWLEKLCAYAHCELPEPRDPSRIELTHKNVFTHPNQSTALMISATIVNQAEFKQDFPLLDIVFSNIRGEDIAGRRFKPEEYLNIPADQIGKMEPGEPVSFNIEIIDSGTELMSYEFTFL